MNKENNDIRFLIEEDRKIGIITVKACLSKDDYESDSCVEVVLKKSHLNDREIIEFSIIDSIITVSLRNKGDDHYNDQKIISLEALTLNQENKHD